MPRPGTPVIHPDWEDRHRPVADGTMTASCAITAPGTGPGVFDPETGTTTPPAGTTIFEGPCRVQARAAADAAHNTGEQQVTTRDYLVSLPVAVYGVQVGHRVAFTAASDTSLVGRSLLVTDVLRGSLLWERDLTCVDDEG